jgi:putative Ca2+/H+ antiporter (TMEM165/GDT1 family)
VLAVLQSFLLVLASEIGDKTQLIALLLVCRYRRPWLIMGGILVATLLNHAMAACAGQFVAQLVDPTILKWVLIATFVFFAGWILIPDKDEALNESSHHGASWTTVIVFFMAEMGDKTQLATVALGARFQSVLAVTTGSTLGMLVADGLVVFMGARILKKIPMRLIHRIAAVLFLLFAVAIYYWN